MPGNVKKEMDEWFEEHFGLREGLDKGESIFGNKGMIKMPAVDIQEMDDKYIVYAELLGVGKEEGLSSHRALLRQLPGSRRNKRRRNQGSVQGRRAGVGIAGERARKAQGNKD